MYSSEYLIISSSLRDRSRSRHLAESLRRSYEDLGIDSVSLLDLREHPLPFCDGGSAYDAPELEPVEGAINAARVILLATPVYNYNINAAAKNVIELTGSSWEGKVVGFACAAGGRSSYMSVMSIANSLMLDFRCVIIPRFVYATDSDFEKTGVPSEQVQERLKRLAVESTQIIVRW